MKTIIELAREAGFVSAQFWPDDFKGLQASVERFATLVKAAHTAELLEGVEMPEPQYVCAPYHPITGHATTAVVNYFTADQLRSTVAAAVLRKDAEIRRMGEDLTAIQTMHNDQKAKLYHDKSELQARAASLSTKLLIADTREKELKAENERLRADADCFNFWVHEAWHSPSAIMKLLNSCETPEDYRNKLLPIMEGRKAAIDAAMKGQP